MIESINWYPGHMKKTRELIQENLKMVDMVIEVIDARIPVSSRNPIIDEIVGEKRRLIVLNKSDLSDRKENEKWTDFFSEQGNLTLAMNCMSGEGVKQLYNLLKREQERKNRDQLRKKNLRLMIVGVPNVGKSSLINRMTGKKSAQTGNRPGVTRGKQWLSLENNMQLLDTPGILWPKFEDPEVGVRLAYTGAVKDDVLDTEALAARLMQMLWKHDPQALRDRYRLEDFPEDVPGYALLEAAGRKRGFLLSRGGIDTERMARVLLEEYRNGKLGRFTLEVPEDLEVQA